MASAQAPSEGKLPKGTAIILYPTEGGQGVVYVLDGVRFLVTRADLNYYNALKSKNDDLELALQRCDAQALRLSPVAGDKETGWWDTGIGTTVRVGGLAVGLSAAFVIGYALGRR